MRFKKLITFILTFLPIFGHIILSPKEVAAAQPTVKLSSVKGDVIIKIGGGLREFPAVEGMELVQGDWLRTGKDGTAKLCYEDGTEATIGGSSYLNIQQLTTSDALDVAAKYRPARITAWEDGHQSSTQLWSGSIWSKVKSLVNIDDKYEVETPTAVMGVRGTLYLVSVDQLTGSTQGHVIDGAVGVSQNNEATQAGPIQVVTMGQTLSLVSIAGPVPENMVLNQQDLIKNTQPEILVALIEDLIARTQEVASATKEAQLSFTQTGNKLDITSAIGTSFNLGELASFGKEFMDNLQKSDKVEAVEQVLQGNNKSLEQVQKTVEAVKTETEQIRSDVVETAKNAGVSQEEINSIEQEVSGAAPVADSTTAPESTTNNNPTTNPGTTPTGNTGNEGNGTSVDKEAADKAAAEKAAAEKAAAEKAAAEKAAAEKAAAEKAAADKAAAEKAAADKAAADKAAAEKAAADKAAADKAAAEKAAAEKAAADKAAAEAAAAQAAAEAEAAQAAAEAAQAAAAAKVATVTSTVYTINSDAINNVSGITTVNALKSNLIAATGATYKIYNGSTEVTQGSAVVTSNMTVVVTSQDGTVTKTYTIIIDSSSSANVGTANELTTALANSSITTITLTASFAASPTITRPLTLNFGAYTLTGDLSFNYTGTGESVLSGNVGNRIMGNLTVNTPNGSFANGVNVSGVVNIVNVKIGTWTESAAGNTLSISDSDGVSIVITGSPGSVTVTSGAGGSLTLTVNAGATIASIKTNAPLNILVAAGATVNNITAAAGSGGTIITNNGTTGTVIANASINLVANVAPTNTITGVNGSVGLTGTNANTVQVVADVAAPVLTSISASAITATTATLNFTTGEAGTYYYLIYPAANEAPNAATIKAQGQAVAKGTAAISAGAITTNVIGLTASTAYKAYVIVEDAAENKSEVAMIEVTTIADQSSEWAFSGMWHLNNNASIRNGAIGKYVTSPAGDDGYIPIAPSGASYWFGLATAANPNNYSAGNFMGDLNSYNQSDLSGGISDTSQNGNLTSPLFTVPDSNNAELTFKSWWEIESVSPHSYDLMKISVKKTNDEIEELATLNPPSGSGQSNLAYTSGGYNVPAVWRNYSFSLSQYAGQQIRFIFSFDTGDSNYNAFRGWFIDSDVKVLSSPLNTPPTLTADSTANDPANPIEITFTDNSAWRTAITAVKDGAAALTGGQYSVTAGKITISAGVLNAATHTISVVATGYNDGIVRQVVTASSSSSSDASLATVLGQAITAGSEAGTMEEPKTASINVASGVGSVAAGDIVKTDSGAAVTFYSLDNTFTTPAAGSVILTADAATVVYIKVTAADSTTVHYAVAINVAQVALPRLTAPEICFDGDLLCWDGISNALAYRVILTPAEGTAIEIEVFESELDLAEQSFLDVGSTYTVTVIAVPAEGSEEHRESEASNEITYIVALPRLTAPEICFDGDLLCWDGISNALAYRVILTPAEGTAIEIEVFESELDLAEQSFLDVGSTYTVTVIAVPAEGSEEHRESEASNEITYIVALPRLTAPEICFDGDLLCWDGISNALAYRVILTPAEGTAIEIEVFESELDLAEQSFLDVGSTYTVTVIAVPAEGSEEHRESKASNEITYIVALP